jgi:hypothetical protein
LSNARTFAAPRPPPLPATMAARGPSPTATLPEQQHRKRPSRVTDHVRAKSLVDAAAQQSGRWPAPPSPLPDALPPPPPPLPLPRPCPAAPDPFGGDWLEGFGAPAAPRANGMGSLSAAGKLQPLLPGPGRGAARSDVPLFGGGDDGLLVGASAPRVPSLLPPPPRLSPPQRQQHGGVNGSGGLLHVTKGAVPAASTLTAGAQGGLSAQDLLFFEGL